VRKDERNARIHDEYFAGASKGEAIRVLAARENVTVTRIRQIAWEEKRRRDKQEEDSKT